MNNNTHKIKINKKEDDYFLVTLSCICQITVTYFVLMGKVNVLSPVAAEL